MDKHLNIRGNRKGYLFFLSIRMKTPIQMALVAGDTVLQHKSITDARVERYINQYLTQESKIIHSTYHRGTLYLITKSARKLPYEIQKKTRAFYALKTLATRKPPKTMEELCELCRFCCFFSQKTTKNPQSWKAWWKMAIRLVQPYVSSDIPFTLGVAKYFGSVANRTRKLTMDVILPVPERPFQCEVLFTQSELGLMYNTKNNNDEGDNITYISPMIVSKPAFKENMLDNSGVKCHHWAMLFIDENHWKDFGITYYLKNFNRHTLPLKLLTFIKTQPQNEKFVRIATDISYLVALLRKP